MSRTTWIKGAHIVDPATGQNEVGDLFFEAGRLAPVPTVLPAECEIVDGIGKVAVPGLWDIHVHLREPGFEAAETVETGSQAAAHGGFTTIVAMPNTRPALDTPERVQEIIEKGKRAGHVRVLTTACITRDRAGRELAPLAELADAGAVAFTDDGCTVPAADLMEQAMIKARELDRIIMDHAQDHAYELKGVMHEGEFSAKYGIPGIPTIAETSIIRRDAELSERTGAHTHIQHITAGKSMDILREFQARGVPITGEVSPHHLALCDADIDPNDANYKMNPPLRSATDRDLLTTGLLDGTAAIFATDHAPHPTAAKQKGWINGPFGVLGLETAVGITYTLLVKTGRLPLLDWVARWTSHPAAILGLPIPSLSTGQPADLVLLDLNREWRVEPKQFLSRSRNTPFGGWDLTGCATRTWLKGTTTWQES